LCPTGYTKLQLISPSDSDEDKNEKYGLDYFYFYCHYKRVIMPVVLTLTVAGMVEQCEQERYLKILTFDRNVEREASDI
jgi:hypothetical protein